MSDIKVSDSVKILKEGECRGSTGIVTDISPDGVAKVNRGQQSKTVKVKVKHLVRMPDPAASAAAATAVAAATATTTTIAENEAPSAPAPAPAPAAAAAAATPATAVATTTTTPISNIESFPFTPSQVFDKVFEFPSSDEIAVQNARDSFATFDNKALKMYVGENGATVGKKTHNQLTNTAMELRLRGQIPRCPECHGKCKELFKDENMTEGILKCTACTYAINSSNVKREAALTLDACKAKREKEKKEREDALEARVMAVEVPEEALKKIAERTETHGRRESVEAWADFMKTPEMRERIDCNDSQLHIGSELSHFFTKNTSDDGITNHENIFRDVLRQWLPRDAKETRTEVLEENTNLAEALKAFIDSAEKANVAKKGTIVISVINRFKNTLVLVTKSKVVVKNTDHADLLKAGFKRVSIDEIRNWEEKSTFNAKWVEKMKTAEASAAAASAAANAGQAPPTV